MNININPARGRHCQANTVTVQPDDVAGSVIM